MAILTLSLDDLCLLAATIMLCGILSIRLSLDFHKSMAVALTRMVLQLLLVGQCLKFLFQSSFGWLALPLLATMLIVAAREVTARQKQWFAGKSGYWVAFVSVSSSSLPMTLVGMFILVGYVDLTDARYIVPLLGIVLGSTMNAVSVSLNHFLTSIKRDSAAVEARLALGHTGLVALSQHRREAVQSGLIPITNQMAGAGLVTLPGIMSGQVLAGADPFSAAQYQIVLLILLASSGAIGVIISVSLMTRHLLDDRERLRVNVTP